MFRSIQKQTFGGLFLSLCLLTSCSKNITEHSAEIFAMDTLVSLTIWGNESNEVIVQSEHYIYAMEDTFSTTIPDSEIYRLNHNDGQWLTVSEEVMEILLFAYEMSLETEGAFHPLMYPLVQKWGFTTGNLAVPDSQEIAQAVSSVDLDLLEIDVVHNAVRLSGDAQLDLGGVAKGYIGDFLANYLRSEGVDSALISLGGNIYTLGAKKDGSLWNIGIQNPYGAGSVGSVAVYDKAVITSGGYQRYFFQGGETYWHIMDSKTGYPAKSGLASVTIITNSGMYGDCLSTALFVMGLDKASDYWREHQDFDVVFISDDGDIYITPGIADSFTLSKGYNSGTLQEILP